MSKPENTGFFAVPDADGPEIIEIELPPLRPFDGRRVSTDPRRFPDRLPPILAAYVDANGFVHVHVRDFICVYTPTGDVYKIIAARRGYRNSPAKTPTDQ